MPDGNRFGVGSRVATNVSLDHALDRLNSLQRSSLHDSLIELAEVLRARWESSSPKLSEFQAGVLNGLEVSAFNIRHHGKRSGTENIGTQQLAPFCIRCRVFTDVGFDCEACGKSSYLVFRTVDVVR